MLHDCAKCLSDKKMQELCEKGGIFLSDFEKRNLFLMHGRVGAYLAKEKYGIENEDIINAIAWHTTGRENMSLLEKIIFVADYIEPGRRQAPNLPEIRELAFLDLDRAMIRILEDTIVYLKNGRGEIDPATEKTLMFYKKEPAWKNVPGKEGWRIKRQRKSESSISAMFLFWQIILLLPEEATAARYRRLQILLRKS